MTLGRQAFNAGQRLAYNTAQQCGRMLFGFEVSTLDNQQRPMPEVVVIAHLARQECIDLQGFCLGNELAACATTQRQGREVLVGSRLMVVAQMGVAQRTADMVQQLVGIHRARQTSPHAAIAHWHDIRHAQQLCKCVVNASYGSIQIGMRRIDADAITDGSQQGTADVVARGVDTLHAVEQQWMVRHNELALTTMSLLDYILGDVEARQDATDLQSRITALKASVVIRFLQLAWSYSLDGVGYVL